MRTAAVFALLLVVAACNGHARAPISKITPVPTLATVGLAPSPVDTPAPLDGSPNVEHDKRLALKAGLCERVQAEETIAGTLYIGCREGGVTAVDVSRRVRAHAETKMLGIESILPAGNNAIAVSGYTSDPTFALVELLRADTLKPILRDALPDSTFLGVVRGRAYIDDWCCFGRTGVYRPATIYSISLQTGTKSERIDLRPDPQAHPGNQQPLGQGEHNYLVGHYLYVVVGFVTYRYDILDLRKPPRRLASAGDSGVYP